jgi:colanic acid biosynthesis glycosyl transferase WcaI
VKQGKDPRFEFGEFLDERGFTQALHDTDVFVITEKPGSGASFIPSKLIPGIASGTPVLAVCDRSGPLGKEMQEAGLGQVLEWSHIGDLPTTLASFIGNPDQFRAWQQNCLNQARTYHRDFAIPRIDALLREAAGKKGSGER